MIQASRKEGEAKRLATSNVRPQYRIPKEEYDTQALLQSRAAQGISGAAKQYYDTSANNALNNTLNAVLKGGGDINTVGGVYQQSLDSRSKFAIADDQARLANINALVQQNQRMSDQRDKAFQINEYAPYADRAQFASKLANSAQQQMNAGMGTAASGVMSAFGSMADKSMINNIAGNGTGAGAGSMVDDVSAIQPVGMKAMPTYQPPQPKSFMPYDASMDTRGLTPEQRAILASLQTTPIDNYQY